VGWLCGGLQSWQLAVMAYRELPQPGRPPVACCLHPTKLRLPAPISCLPHPACCPPAPHCSLPPPGCSPNGTHLLTLTRNVSLYSAYDLAVDWLDRVWVTDGSQNRIVRVSGWVGGLAGWRLGGLVGGWHVTGQLCWSVT